MRLKRLALPRLRRSGSPAQLPLDLALPSAQVIALRRPAPASERAAPSADDLRECAYAVEPDDPAQAIELWREVTRATDAADDWAALLAVLHDSGRAEEAAELARPLRSQFVDSAPLQFNCGIALHAQHHHAEAAAAYEAALKLDAGLVDAHRYLHECYEALGQQQLAVRHGSAWLRGRRPRAP